ncbi:hypothetical protein [Desulfosarcina alkanivorans]|nr:hypothetical protein [Desulfosarcina alkanivorans]
MKKAWDTCFSRTGKTKAMANFIAEGMKACQDCGKALGEKLA